MKERDTRASVFSGYSPFFLKQHMKRPFLLKEEEDGTKKIFHPWQDLFHDMQHEVISHTNELTHISLSLCNKEHYERFRVPIPDPYTLLYWHLKYREDDKEALKYVQLLTKEWNDRIPVIGKLFQEIRPVLAFNLGYGKGIPIHILCRDNVPHYILDLYASCLSNNNIHNCVRAALSSYQPNVLVWLEKYVGFIHEWPDEKTFRELRFVVSQSMDQWWIVSNAEQAHWIINKVLQKFWGTINVAKVLRECVLDEFMEVDSSWALQEWRIQHLAQLHNGPIELRDENVCKLLETRDCVARGLIVQWIKKRFCFIPKMNVLSWEYFFHSEYCTVENLEFLDQSFSIDWAYIPQHSLLSFASSGYPTRASAIAWLLEHGMLLHNDSVNRAFETGHYDATRWFAERGALVENVKAKRFIEWCQQYGLSSLH
jgi:hypothetical protein